MLLDDSVGPAIIDHLGGVDQLKLEIQEAVVYTSTLRKKVPACWSKYFVGGGGLVAKISFADGICWADKMFSGFRQTQNGSYEEAVM